MVQNNRGRTASCSSPHCRRRTVACRVHQLTNTSPLSRINNSPSYPVSNQPSMTFPPPWLTPPTRPLVSGTSKAEPGHPPANYANCYSLTAAMAAPVSFTDSPRWPRKSLSKLHPSAECLHTQSWERGSRGQHPAPTATVTQQLLLEDPWRNGLSMTACFVSPRQWEEP